MLAGALSPLALAQSYLTTTFAGSSRLLDGHPANTVPLRYPWGIVQDASGNVYFADTSDNRVRRVDPTGIISTVAGNGQPGYSGDNGPATSAQLRGPQGIALDSKGNLFICDYQNEVVRKVVLATGVISTVVGNTRFNYSGDGGAATAAGIDPYDIAVDTAGNLYISDFYNNRIRKVSATAQTISSLAGITTPGDGDNGPANQAALDGPLGISVDAGSNVYFVDFNNNRVKMINQAANHISTVAGSGNFGTGEASLDGDGGKATQANLYLPFSTAIEPNGNLLVESVFELWRVTVADGNIHFVSGNPSVGFAGDGSAASSAVFAVPIFVAAAPNDDILISDVGNFRIRRIHNGVINTLAGTAILDNIPATSAFLSLPDGVLPDGKGGVLIADTGDSRIRRVANGTIANFYGSGIRGSDANQLYFPSGMAIDSQGDLFFADTSNDRVLRLLNGGGSPTVFAGGNGTGFSGDGQFAPTSMLAGPSGVAVDAAGNVYIADAGNFRIRMVNVNQQISTLAGNGNPKATGDNGPAASAGLTVNDLAVVGGSLYFADTANHRIRKIDLSTKIISTVAGIGTSGYTGDGGSPFSAQLSFPNALALDAAGNLFIADTGNSVIREISGGKITTVAGAGPGNFEFTVDTGTALGVPINPTRIFVNTDGSLYITDQLNDRIRKLTPQTAANLSIASGNNQSGTPGSVLVVTVKVVDATSAPVGNVLVNFTVATGSATLSPSGVTTGSDGTASVQVTLGSTAGPVTITAASAGLTPVTFALTVTAAQPTTPVPTINTNGVQGSGFSTPPVMALSTGGIATVKGANFGGSAAFTNIGAADLVNSQVPVNYHAICVTVGGTRAPITGASSAQVNFITPVVTGTTAAVVVIAGCDTATPLQSAPVNIPIQTATPEFFYFANNPNGQNPVAAADSITGAYLVSSTLYPGAGFIPAKPGELVTVYGTGFGPTNPPVAPGVFFEQQASVPPGTATVTLNGNTLPAANVTYVGLTPGSPGLYQLNITLPPDTPNGDLPLVIAIGGLSSSPGAYLTVQQ